MPALTSPDLSPVLHLFTREALIDAINRLDDASIADLAQDWWMRNGDGIRFWLDEAAFRSGLPVRWDLPDTVATKCGIDLETASAILCATNDPDAIP